MYKISQVHFCVPFLLVSNWITAGSSRYVVSMSLLIPKSIWLEEYSNSPPQTLTLFRIPLVILVIPSMCLVLPYCQFRIFLEVRKIDSLMMVRTGSKLLWVHLVCAWLFSGIGYTFVYKLLVTVLWFPVVANMKEYQRGNAPSIKKCMPLG